MTVTLLLSLPAIAEELKFTSEVFDRFDPKELAALYRRNQVQSNWQAHLNTNLIELFLAERNYLAGYLEAAQTRQNRLLQFCEQEAESKFENLKGESRARCAYLCVLGQVGFSGQPDPVRALSQGAKIQAWLQIAKDSPLSFEERAHAEGRIYARLTPEQGRNFGKSLMALESLKRLRPALTSTDFFIGQAYQAQGNMNGAGQAYERAMSRDDVRAKLVFENKPISLERGAENPQSRYYWGIIGSPAAGVGARVGYLNERWLDTRRKIDVSVYGASRGVGGVSADYQDREIWPEWTLWARLGLEYDYDQFFGIGMSSLLTDLVSIRQLGARGRVQVLKEWGYFFAGAGWELLYVHPDKFETVSPFIPAYLNQVVAASGLVVSLGLDSRAPRVSPRRGSRLLAEGFFPQIGAGSSHTFQEYRLRAQHLIPLTHRSTLDLHVETSSVSSAAPYAAIRKLSGSAAVPGVRYGRFQDLSLLAGWAEVDYPVMGSIVLSAFGTAGTVAPAWGEVFSTPVKFGGGGALQYGQRGFGSRVEAGIFGGETVIQASVRISGG